MNKLLTFLVFLGVYVWIIGIGWGWVLVLDILPTATKLDITLYSVMLTTIATITSGINACRFYSRRYIF